MRAWGGGSSGSIQKKQGQKRTGEEILKKEKEEIQDYSLQERNVGGKAEERKQPEGWVRWGGSINAQ